LIFVCRLIGTLEAFSRETGWGVPSEAYPIVKTKMSAN
jgi:hypothetical protein